MEQYILYLALKEMVNSLNNNFKCSFNDMDSNKDNVVGIYIKGAEPSTYRTLKDGKYYNMFAWDCDMTADEWYEMAEELLAK